MSSPPLQAAPSTPEDFGRFGPDPRASLERNLRHVEERVARACERARRDRNEVELLPVTKTVPAHILRHAFEAGMRRFGENKIQEATTKRLPLIDLDPEWVIVGHLQTNKVRHLIGIAGEFHALDSLRLANALNRRLEREDRFLDVFIQVNTSNEASKYGLHPDELESFLETLPRYPRLKARGLMTLAVFDSDMEKVRPCFELLRRLRDRARERHSSVTQLSMGMSGDFEIAIEEGADIVRVGQAIFGLRPTPDGHYWPKA